MTGENTAAYAHDLASMVAMNRSLDLKLLYGLGLKYKYPYAHDLASTLDMICILDPKFLYELGRKYKYLYAFHLAPTLDMICIYDPKFLYELVLTSNHTSDFTYLLAFILYMISISYFTLIYALHMTCD